MAFASDSGISEPMGDMNTTPLIDVMLVLLIMFIITIPIATNSIDIDLPGKPPVVPIILEPIQNKLVLTQDERILWNGHVVDEGELFALLQQSAMLDPEPELQFEPEALASYDSTARIMQLVTVSGVTRFGFVGNERYRQFAAAD